MDLLEKLREEHWRVMCARPKDSAPEGGIVAGGVKKKRPKRAGAGSKEEFLYFKCLVAEAAYTLVVTDLVSLWGCEVSDHSLSNEKRMYNPQLEVELGAIPAMLEQHFLCSYDAARNTKKVSIERFVDDASILHLQCSCAIEFYTFIWKFMCYPIDPAGPLIRDHFIRPLCAIATQQSFELHVLTSALRNETVAECDVVVPLDGSFVREEFTDHVTKSSDLQQRLQTPSVAFMQDPSSRAVLSWMYESAPAAADAEKLAKDEKDANVMEEEGLHAASGGSEPSGSISPPPEGAVLTPPMSDKAAPEEVTSPSKGEYVETFEELQRRKAIQEKLELKKRKREDDGAKKKKKKRIKLV